MFADFSQALAAEHLPVPHQVAVQEQAAARAVARRAHDHAALARLLRMLGLPTDETTLIGLQPYLTDDSTDDQSTGEPPTMTTPNAFEAMALSMHHNGDAPETICEATGLTRTELEQLLAWAEAHRMAIRNRVARIRTDLTELAAHATSLAEVG
ncbi:hypothetical protein [Streptomyces megasporus]|uniref:hypothetical protein n=1 Tax=Streptomyces megasporus TaxID=44060 RepID=UPI0004E28CC9|nr:hypothetical protein [Streptomyces megasporus]